jgi:hypothetical protein
MIILAALLSSLAQTQVRTRGRPRTQAGSGAKPPPKELAVPNERSMCVGTLYNPSHGLRILRNEAGAGFSPKAAYIFRKQLEETGVEVAHLKLIGLSDVSSGVENLVSSITEPELSQPSHAWVPTAQVIVNVRVAADPALLEGQARQMLKTVCHSLQAAAEILSLQSFRPGRPQPTHR